MHVVIAYTDTSRQWDGESRARPTFEEVKHARRITWALEASAEELAAAHAFAALAYKEQSPRVYAFQGSDPQANFDEALARYLQEEGVGRPEETS